MRKALFVLLVIFLIFAPEPVSAAQTQNFKEVFGEVVPPSPIQAIGKGSAGISNVLNKFIQLLYVAASILALFMIIFSAIQWITSGGDKEAIGKARARLTYAVIGIILLALAFVILNILGEITGFTFFRGQVDY